MSNVRRHMLVHMTQVAFEVCSTVFGPERGVLVDTNDCIDLATAAIRDKMVDLYHQVVEGLMVYLGQKLPGLEPETILGHIGRIPEKVRWGHSRAKGLIDFYTIIQSTISQRKCSNQVARSFKRGLSLEYVLEKAPAVIPTAGLKLWPGQLGHDVWTLD